MFVFLFGKVFSVWVSILESANHLLVLVSLIWGFRRPKQRLFGWSLNILNEASLKLEASIFITLDISRDFHTFHVIQATGFSAVIARDWWRVSLGNMGKRMLETHYIYPLKKPIYLYIIIYIYRQQCLNRISTTHPILGHRHADLPEAEFSDLSGLTGASTDRGAGDGFTRGMFLGSLPVVVSICIR